MHIKLIFYAAIVAVLSLLSSCASEPLLLTKSAEEDYHHAKRLVEKEDYGRAALYLQKFSAKYPFSQYATAADLLRIKSAFLDEQYVLSETLGLRFINAHPEHKDRIYAEYIVAMSYYKQSSSAHLDQQFSHKAREAFIALDKQHPDNPYTADILKYLQILTNRIAKYEMLVGQFYYDKQLYVAASNRFIHIKNKYLDADIAAESLYLLVSSYIALDQQSYAEEVLVTLTQKFPGNEWSNKAQKLM